MIADDERRLLQAIHADPRSTEALLAYGDWLAANGETDRAECLRLAAQDDRPTHHETLRFGHYVGPSGTPLAASRTRIGQLIYENISAWTGSLPPGVGRDPRVMTGRETLRGLPLVFTSFAPRITADELNYRCQQLSPRNLLELEIRIHPASVRPVDRQGWWGEDVERIRPALERASMVRLTFRDPHAVSENGRLLRLGPALYAKHALAFIRDFAGSINPTRTPWISIYHASLSVKKFSTELLGEKCELSILD